MWSRATGVVMAAFLAIAAPGSTRAETGLEGQLVDAVTGEPVGWAIVLITELDRHAHADVDGCFLLAPVPPGNYTLRVVRIGYHQTEQSVVVGDDGMSTLHVPLKSKPVRAHETLVEAHEHRSALEAPAQVMEGGRLRQSLGRTIAETIALEPGLSQRSMGPAPARPVLRGLGGDRLLVLEDGGRTGDLSATSSDHAVAIEPLTTERVEIVRGPEAILFGGNTLGGVIDVVRGAVPTERVDDVVGSFAWQAETVNMGGGGGMDVSLPAGPLTIRLDGSLRRSDDTGTPAGTLVNTDLMTDNGAVGTGFVRSWGSVGGAYSLYDSDYGIPPDPEGGHPSGVDIRLDRRHQELRADLHPARWPWLQSLDLTYTHNRFFQEEIEASGAIGLEFGVLTTNAEARARLVPVGPLQNVTGGVWTERRDYKTSGLSFTPDTRETAAAAFVYGEWPAGPWAYNASLRWDGRRLKPEEERFSEQVGLIRERTFQGLSGGLAVERQLGAWHLGATAMRSFRAPQVEETFSRGPHLAAYSFEVGNAEIESEQGLGLELTARWHSRAGRVAFAVFRNAFDGYIYPRNTGEISLQRGDLFLYRFVGEDALMWGVEGTWELHLSSALATDGSVSFVRGRIDDGEDLPAMPPLQGKAGLRWQARPNLEGRIASCFATEQGRPGPFENPTDGYVVLDLSASWHRTGFGLLHTLSVSVDNVLDTTYRRHLNRVRQIMPEPGRNLRILHKAFF